MTGPTLGRVTEPEFSVRPVGHVESVLLDRSQAPKQGDEGAPSAWLVFHDDIGPAARDLVVDSEVLVLTWLDRARREVLTTRPRDDRRQPERGVFSTRSPDRPNPIGLHRVRIVAVEGLRVQVDALEALDGTPIVDVKPVLVRADER